MREEKNYTNAQNPQELLYALKLYASTYDYQDRAKRFAEMKSRAEHLAASHDSLYFTGEEKDVFGMSYEFNGTIIGTFSAELHSNLQDMTFKLSGLKTLGTTESVQTIAHIEKLDRGVLEIVPTKFENPFLVERGLLSIETIDYLFFKFLSYLAYITRP